MRRAGPLVALLVAPALAGCLLGGGGAEALRLGSTTSTEESGILDALTEAFTRDTGVPVETVVRGTGEVIEVARRGDVDVLLTHSPERERAFVASGDGLSREPVMRNGFLLVGPPSDPAGARGAASAADAFRRVADNGSSFASRADASGTHDRELALWRAAGVDPERFDAAHYLETGSGQTQTLLVAEEEGAYALTDDATWAQLRARGRLAGLAVLFEGDAALRNAYAVVPVNASRHAGVREDLALRFAEWITTEPGQSVIRGFRIGDAAVFTPDAARPEG